MSPEGFPTIPVRVPSTFSHDPGIHQTTNIPGVFPEVGRKWTSFCLLRSVCPVAGPGSQTPASPSMASGASMLTTRENQIICRDFQIVGSPSENARAQTLEFNKGEADGIGKTTFWDMRACVPDRRLNVSFQSVGFDVTGGEARRPTPTLHGVDNPGVAEVL